MLSILLAPNPKPRLPLGIFLGENIPTFLWACPSDPDPATFMFEVILFLPYNWFYYLRTEFYYFEFVSLLPFFAAPWEKVVYVFDANLVFLWLYISAVL